MAFRKRKYLYMQSDGIFTGAGGIALDSTLATFEDAVIDHGINVKWFGAKGDGITDDYAAMQAAADVVHNAGGGILLVPASQHPYRITQPLRLGADSLGNPVNGVVLMGASNATSIIRGDFTNIYAGRAVVEFGSATATSNFHHSIRDIRIYNSTGTPQNCYGLRVFNAYVFAADRVVIYCYNGIDLARAGSTTFTFLNFSARNCQFYANYGLDAGSPTAGGGYSINNTYYFTTGTHWDSVEFDSCSTNAACICAASQAKFTAHQFNNLYHTPWLYTSTGYAGDNNLQTFCLAFNEGSLVLDQCNFESYQNGAYIGGFNRYVDGVVLRQCNFNGVSYVQGTEHGANGVVLASGGIGHTKNIHFEKCTFMLNQRCDICLDNDGNNSDTPSEPYVSHVTIDNGCVSRTVNNQFDVWQYQPTITAQDGTTTTLTTTDPNSPWLKQLINLNNAKIRINGTSYAMGAATDTTLVVLNGGTSLGTIGQAVDYYRDSGDAIIRRVTAGTSSAGQIIYDYPIAAAAPTLTPQYAGDTITLSAPAAGISHQLTCTANGRPGTWLQGAALQPDSVNPTLASLLLTDGVNFSGKIGRLGGAVLDIYGSAGSNLGLGANGNRYAIIDTSGNLTLGNSSAGGGAPAGAMILSNCTFPTSSPSAGIAIGAASQELWYYGAGGLKYLSGMAAAAPTYGTLVVVDARVASHFTITVTDGVAFTIASPLNAVAGEAITLILKNSSGGAMGAITWSTIFKQDASFVAPANGKMRSGRFEYDGTNWILAGAWSGDI